MTALFPAASAIRVTEADRSSATAMAFTPQRPAIPEAMASISSPRRPDGTCSLRPAEVGDNKQPREAVALGNGIPNPGLAPVISAVLPFADPHACFTPYLPARQATDGAT
jgi:hypothetical protein